MSKKNISLASILLTTTLTLAGCQTTNQENNSQNSNESSNTSTSESTSSSTINSSSVSESSSSSISESASSTESQSESSSTVESSSSSISESVSSTESQSESSSTVESSSEETSSEYPVNDSFEFPSDGSTGHPTVEVMPKTLPAYTPTTFNASSYKKEFQYTVTDGLDVYKVTYTLNDKNNRKITAYFAEANLRKVNIVGGSYNNVTTAQFANKSTPVSMAKAWERDNPGKSALLTINADFFGSTCVNAFVKDGVILKASHINDPNDLPASSPMLFGVSSAGARIGAMTTTGNRTTDYTSSLYYGSCIDFYDEDQRQVAYGTGGNNNAANKADSFCTINKYGTYTIPAGVLYKFKRLSSSTDDEVKGCIVEKTELTKLKGLRVTSDEINSGYGYIGAGKFSDLKDLEIGTYFKTSQYLASPSNTWDYYDTILGCRQSILENGSIPATVAQEGGANGNSVEYAAPRSCVGIKPDGTVVILSIEDFIRNANNANCNGINISQIADLMRYYGVYDAANFDGGGSSQLCTKTPGKDWKVVVRSSDYQSYEPESTRKVLNSLIVTTK